MYYEQRTAVTWFVVPCYLLTIVVGTFGNLIVLRAYLRGERVWSKPYNLILTNGVVADLIICLIFTPLLLLYRGNASARLIEYSPLCEISAFTSMLAISLQYVVFPLLSLNRMDIVLSDSSPWLNQKRCKKLLVAGWFLCIAASTVLVALLRLSLDIDDTPKLHRCILVNTKWDTYAIYFLGYSTLLYLASSIVAISCYRQVYAAVSPTGSSDAVLSIDDTRRTKMCMIVAIVYTLFWTPFLFVQLYGLFSEYSELVFNCHALASAVGVMASAVNPYLYSFMDHYYKKKFINIFKFVQNED